MDIQTRKISFVQEFLKINNEAMISKLESMLRELKVEQFQEEMHVMSVEQFNADIDKAVDDADNDRVISVKDLKEKVKQWR